MADENNTNHTHEDELLDHNYDGIQEYDNPIPGWWHLIFLGSIVFSICYVVVWHLTPIIPTREQRHANAVAAAEEAQFGPLRDMPMDSNKILAVMGNDKWLSAGESIFKGTCAVCHGQQGEGIEALGLNLTDETYLYVEKITDIADVVKNGTPSNKMPPQVQFNENEIAMVAGYVATLRGKNIEGPASQVQGVEIPPFPQPQSQAESLPSDG